MARSLAHLPFLVLAVTAALPLRSLPAQDLVVTPQWLASHLNDADLVILHVGPEEGYPKGHIPGARFVGLRDMDGNRDRDPGRLTLEMPAPADLRARLEALGISDRSRIVVVEAGEWYSPATRMVFTLQYAGLGPRTSWLDGGLEAWVAAGHPTTTSGATAAGGRITRGMQPELIVDHAFLQALGGRTGVKLIDARSPMFFAGPVQQRNGRTETPGHIEGAASLPFNTLVGEDGRFLPRDSLTAMFRTAGVQPGDTVVAYCHVGQQATLVLFAARLLGHPVRLYDGSMDDWAKRGLPLVGTLPARP